MHANGNIETMAAATGHLVWDLDALPYELNDGPCVSSLRQDPVIVVVDLAHSRRWPELVPRAVKRGLEVEMSLRGYVDEDGTIEPSPCTPPAARRSNSTPRSPA